MEDHYPGSRRTKKTYDSPPVIDTTGEEDWLAKSAKPKIYLLNGQPVEFYPLGAVASALNRKPVTIRKLESEGVIPKSPYIMPSHDPRGQRRLYTRGQIDKLRKIAEEEGLLEPSAGGKWKPIDQTNFRAKALKAFKEE